jgi:hypothetical protein
MHPFPSPIVPGSLTGDLTATGAHHLVVDRLSRAPSNQINPSTIIPYPHPCLTTSSITWNRNHDEEPPRNLVDGRFFPTPAGSPPPLRPATRHHQPPPPSGTWAHAHDAVPHWRAKLGRPPARPRACPAGPNPVGPANRKLFIFFLFSFSFPIFHIYVYILIFYAPKTV